MLLLRMANLWRICGVLHSELKYMDDELRAKPTPDQNPLLGRKISTLYHLLTTREIQKNTKLKSNSESGANSETPDTTIECDTSPNAPANETQTILNDNIETSETSDTRPKDAKPTKTFFENASMCLSLPIPVDSSQRLLMINIGDDFTHLWFPTWSQKYLSAKKIQHSLAVSKHMDTAFEMSHGDNHPKVFVSKSHDNCIFIGPYGNTDRQNLALFVKHNNHMMLSDTYYKNNLGDKYTRKTKGMNKEKNVFHHALICIEKYFNYFTFFSLMDLSILLAKWWFCQIKTDIGKF